MKPVERRGLSTYQYHGPIRLVWPNIAIVPHTSSRFQHDIGNLQAARLHPEPFDWTLGRQREMTTETLDLQAPEQKINFEGCYREVVQGR